MEYNNWSVKFQIDPVRLQKKWLFGCWTCFTHWGDCASNWLCLLLQVWWGAGWSAKCATWRVSGFGFSMSLESFSCLIVYFLFLSPFFMWGMAQVGSKFTSKHEPNLWCHTMKTLRKCWPRAWFGRTERSRVRLLKQEFLKVGLKISPPRWWFQTFFIFTPTWGNDPIWLIFFKWVETTN